MNTVTFYHSAICPRCGLVKLWLASLKADFPQVRVERVEFLTHPRQAREAGVRAIPTLVAGDRRLSGFLLTRGAIRTFLESLAPEPSSGSPWSRSLAPGSGRV